MDKRPLKVFLCHAHADRDPVRALYARLTKDGVDAWLDKEKLLPGQDWELEIKKAVREADVVVVCLSKQFNQAGFRQKEVRLALDTAMEQPEGEIFIIPARLEECDNLESLRKWHWVDLFEDEGYKKLIWALQKRAGSIEVTLSQHIEQPILEEKSSKFTKDNPNGVRVNKVDVGGNVYDSVIVVGHSNVINMGAQPAFSQQSNIHKVVEEIKTHIEFGLYSEAYKKCLLHLSNGENISLINLLAGISYSLDKRKKLRRNDWTIIEKHIAMAMQNDEIRSTALVILGCVKYAPFYLSKLYDPSELNLSFIKKELKTGSPFNKELLKLIDPMPEELGYLEVQI